MRQALKTKQQKNVYDSKFDNSKKQLKEALSDG